MTSAMNNMLAVDSPVITAAPRRSALMTRVLKGSAWTVLGYGFSQTLRFGSNLVLTYLLAREAFGIMATATIFLMALQMFTDVGIGPSIIQLRRGDEQAYLNTAWTVQVVRGVVLWLIACGLAWPVSRVWGHELLYVLPVVGLTALFAGVQSTSLFTLQRKVRLGALTALGVGTDLVAKIVIVIYALISPTVWSLVVGSLVGSALLAGCSHLLDRGHRHRLTWNKPAAMELYRFGRWLTLSTIITFMAGNLEKLLFAPLFGNAQFGVFWISVMLAGFGPTLMKRLGTQVGFPALSDLYRRDQKRFLYRLSHLRLAMIVPVHLYVLVVIGFGGMVVMWIYPAAYAAAAWMLPLLVAGSIAGVINRTYGNAYMAIGATFYVMLGVAGQVVAIAGAVTTGYLLAGEHGFVIGYACVQWLMYPLFAVLSIRRGIWQPRIDLPALAVSGSIAVALFMA